MAARGRPRKYPLTEVSGPTVETPQAATSLTEKKRGRPPKEVSEMRGAVMDIFLAGVEVKITDAIEEKTQNVADDIRAHLDNALAQIEKNTTIKIETSRGTKEVQGLTHHRFPDLLKAISTKFPLMMVGSAGSGKTFAAEQVANAFDLPFYAISVGSQTSKTDLLGYMTADGKYIPTAFRNAYEHGGVFLMDEIDAGNPNVLIVLNSALAGHSCAFPDKMVRRHDDFYFVSTANTYGNGASRQYVGRNQLDAATLDRFLPFDWPIDETLENSMVSVYPQGDKWHLTVMGLREMVNSRNYRLIISPRATQKGAALLEKGFSIKDVVEMSILGSATDDQRGPLMSEAMRLWSSV